MECINATGLHRESGQRGTQPSLPVEETAGPSASPDFLSKAISSVDFMWLSLRRAAYVAAGRAVR
jgi:hypothetical protein